MSDQTQGRGKTLFESLATAILERGRPRVVAWMQARFGSGAELGAIGFEDARVHLEDARVPLTRAIVLTIARASIEVVSVAPPRIALSALEGVLTSAGGLRADVRFAAENTVGEAWVDGRFTVVQATWPSSADRLVGAVNVNVTSDRWTLSDGALTVGEACIALSGRGDIDADGLSVIEEAKLVIEDARAAPFATALKAIAGFSFELGAFVDSVVAGSVVVRGGAGHVDLTARDALGALHVTGTVAESVDLKFQGEIVVPRALAAAGVGARYLPVEDDRAAVSGTVRGPASSPQMLLHGELGEVRFARGAISPITIDADVKVARRPVGTFVAKAWNTELRGEVGERVEVRFEDASARLVDDLSCIARLEPKLAWPNGTRVSGVIEIGDRVTGDVAFETEGSAILCPLRFENGSFSGTKMRGRASVADARALGFLPSWVRPEGIAKIDGRYENDLVIDVTAPKASLDFGFVSLALREVEATVVVGDRVTLQSARASAHGGKVFASGVVDGAWTVRAEAVRIEDCSPIVGAEVRGLLTGNLRYEGGAGSAQVRLDHPVYLAIRRLAPQVAKLGLPLPRPEGIAPLDATLSFSFEPEIVRVSTLAASIDGVTLTGAGAIGPARVLSGRLYATAAAHWLRMSPLLAIPSLLASNVTVPIALGGTLNHPKFDADTTSLMKNTLGFDPVGAASNLASAFGSIWSPPPARPTSTAPARSELDVILDRILDHDPDSESLIAKLVDRGIDPDEFERLLEARRRARRT